MKDQYIKLANEQTKKAISFENQAHNEMRNGSGEKAMEYMKKADHYKLESTRYRMAAETL